jgi:hypothetical protein
LLRFMRAAVCPSVSARKVHNSLLLFLQRLSIQTLAIQILSPEQTFNILINHWDSQLGENVQEASLRLQISMNYSPVRIGSSDLSSTVVERELTFLMSEIS